MRRQTYPPLSKAELEKLRADAGDIPGVAKRRNVTLDAWDLRSESAAAKQHFALGCWLYYYSQRIGLTGHQGLRDRIDCARRIFEAGFANPGYAFFTVFHFGEREFDTLFEMGDGAAVVDALRKLSRKSQHQHIKEAFSELGWILAPVVVQNASQIQLAL